MTIKGPFISFNEYIDAERTNRFHAASIKKSEMEAIMWQLPNNKYTEKIDLTFQFFLKDRRKDPDSVMFTVKCFLDAMVKRGLIENDGQKQIGRITLEPIQIGEECMKVRIEC